MSDAVAVAARVSTVDGLQDLFDHEISLVDSTSPDAARSSDQSPPVRLTKDTRTSIRDQLAQRKYARYSYERYSKTASVTTDEAVDNQEPVEAHPESTAHPNNTGTVDLANQARTRGKGKIQKGPEAEIDVLYENQRGSFLFGMPLYSHSSLLNFDPAAWVTKDLKDSPVDITNAQVPDLTWEWAWKSWYVDMGHDVDEEGWQYSFAFGKNSIWHGNHPWFHSFVRRRRWLRKRIKTGHGPLSSAKLTALTAAHNLTSDYFTIHPARERSPGGNNPDSCISERRDKAEEGPEDVKDVGSLMQALKLARIDREKIEIVKKFINDGGQELAYLKQMIPEIMSFFVFQNSKEQFLTYLELAVKEAKKPRERQVSEERRADADTEQRRIDGLLATAETVNQEIRGLDYWSDRQHVLIAAGLKPQNVKPIGPFSGAASPEADTPAKPVGATEGSLSVAEADVNATDGIVVEAPQQLQSDTAPQQANFYSFAKVSKVQVGKGARTISVKTLQALSDVVSEKEVPRPAVAPCPKLKRKRSDAAEEGARVQLGSEQIQKSLLTKRAKGNWPPAVPGVLQELGDIFQHFLRAFALHLAHNGSSSPAELDALLCTITRLYKKRNVRREDAQRMLALFEVGRQSVNGNRALLLHNRSPFRLVVSGIGLSARHTVEYCSDLVYDEVRLLQGYDEIIRSVCTSGCNENATFISGSIEQYPLLAFAKGFQTMIRQDRASAVRNHILNITPQRQHEASNLKAAMEPDLSRLSISGPDAALQTPPSTKSRTLSLFDRIKTKQAAALLQPVPSSSQLLYRHAIGRIADVVEILRMKQNQRAVLAASTCNKLTLSMSQAVSTVKGSLAVPMGEEEIRLCFKILAEDVEGDWLKLVEMGGFQSVVVQGRCMRGEEVKTMLTNKALPN
ncbi:hypothetical protein DV737_g4772, partial [Chaetothyriales sp. CBS 132003]